MNKNQIYWFGSSLLGLHVELKSILDGAAVRVEFRQPATECVDVID
jgi:hypothetical protein